MWMLLRNTTEAICSHACLCRPHTHIHCRTSIAWLSDDFSVCPLIAINPRFHICALIWCCLEKEMTELQCCTRHRLLKTTDSSFDWSANSLALKVHTHYTTPIPKKLGHCFMSVCFMFHAKPFPQTISHHQHTVCISRCVYFVFIIWKHFSSTAFWKSKSN